MLIFIVPFKPKSACKSWEKACKMLANTLKSICAQSKVICCYTDKPDIDFSHPSLIFLEVAQRCTDEIDKTNKILRGLEYAEKFAPAYIMVVDADDLVSKKLAEYVLSIPLCDGFVIQEGFVHEVSTGVFYRLKTAFNMHCGSCLIVPIKTAKNLISEDLSWWDHQAKHLKLSAIPFEGAIYNIMHGENMSADSPIQNRPIFDEEIEICRLTNDIKIEFGF